MPRSADATHDDPLDGLEARFRCSRAAKADDFHQAAVLYERGGLAREARVVRVVRAGDERDTVTGHCVSVGVSRVADRDQPGSWIMTDRSPRYHDDLRLRCMRG